MTPDKDGVRIASLDEMSYRKLLWDHTPLTDFWRIGKGISKKLNDCGLKTMGDIAKFSIKDEDVLYKLFGINAELIIDHAWGVEPCTMKHIKEYRPMSKSIGSGQVLHEPYDFDKAKLVFKEMVDNLALDLTDKGYITNQIVISIGYDILNLTDPLRASKYDGEIVIDYLGRLIPKHAHGTCNLPKFSASSRMFITYLSKLFDRIVDKNLLIRRINIAATSLRKSSPSEEYYQMSIFDTEEDIKNQIDLEKERKVQESILNIKKKFGKNAVMKGMNLEEGATMKERNNQIGGHKA
jgi:DNA polymerase V